jgi:predicted RNase H-like HicB family nuclease
LKKNWGAVSFQTSKQYTLYIYYMTSRAIYQNIFPEVAGKPWRVMSPDAEEIMEFSYTPDCLFQNLKDWSKITEKAKFNGL